jgi:putative transposase
MKLWGQLLKNRAIIDMQIHLVYIGIIAYIKGGVFMPRAARIKDPEAIYHVMARSITEFDMFPADEDKNHFLDLLKICKEKYRCRVYAYCLMTNHFHIMLDTNGFDISKFMKSLNQRYVRYINKKYSRRGHLLAERFNSKIVTNSEYALTVSAYIHNNVKDLPGYSNRVFEYPFSSMGIYLGKLKDRRNLIDTDFILGYVNENDRIKAIKAYTEMVVEKREVGINVKLRKYLEEFAKEQYEYKSYRTVLFRDKKPEEIISKLAEKFGIQDPKEIMHRWKRNSMRVREAVAYALTVFCGLGTKEACVHMKNITGTCLARLVDKGFKQFVNNPDLFKFLIRLD